MKHVGTHSPESKTSPWKVQGPSHCQPSSFRWFDQLTIVAMSLSSRLDRVLSQGNPESVESFRTLAAAEMGESKVTFGRAHVGRTNEEMWRSEKGWIRWFAKTYASSQKEEHQKLLIYIETMVNQHETLYDMTPMTARETNQEVIRPRPKGQPKSKAAASPAQVMPMTSEIFEEGEAWEPWDVMYNDVPTAAMISPQQEMIDALQSRVLNVENALTEILNHVRQTHQAAP